MITEKELLEGIDYCKIGEPTPEKMICLASYLSIYDRLFGTTTTYSMAQPAEERTGAIHTSGKTDFLMAVNGKSPEKVMVIVDELAETVKTLHPKAYESVMKKIRDI